MYIYSYQESFITDLLRGTKKKKMQLLTVVLDDGTQLKGKKTQWIKKGEVIMIRGTFYQELPLRST